MDQKVIFFEKKSLLSCIYQLFFVSLRLQNKSYFIYMSRVKLIEPYGGLSGKISKNSSTILRTRNGRTHAYEITHPNLLPHNEAQKAHTSLFGQVSAQVRAEKNDPERLTYWEQQYRQYRIAHKAELDNLKHAPSNELKGYSSRQKPVITSLHGFIFHTLFEAAKAENAAPQNPNDHDQD